MIDLKTIKNTETHPYIYGVRGEYLPQLLMVSLFVFVGGFGIMGILAFKKEYFLAFLIFLLVICLLLLVLYFFKRVSKSPPFKGLKTTADFITHINFKKITKNGN